MQAAELKPLLTALALPPAGPLLLALVGTWMARAGRRLGLALVLLSLAALWLLSCHALAVEMARALLPQAAPTSLVQLRQQRVQAVVVLGGGVLPEAPEYGVAQPSATTLARLRYGVRLARTGGLPLAFSGGMGWAGSGKASEAEAARLAARSDLGFDIRWLEGQARDTAENATRLGPMLRRDGIHRIALVSDATHLPRAVLEFRRAGFEVVPAPTALPAQTDRPLLEWLPSGRGLAASREVLREWLAWQLARW